MNTASFNTHYIEFKHALYAYIVGMVKNEEVAKDLVQDLYLKLYDKRRSLKKESIRFYIFRAAKNSCIDWFRKNSGKQEVEFSIEYETGFFDNGDKKELQYHFRRLIDTLPANYREVIYLKDVCEMETDEVMKITDLTENNIRVILSRARTKVKNELAKIYTYEAARKS